MANDDSSRPSVLAHQRFTADRDSFAGLDLAKRFQRIHETNLWGATASVSGLGSETDATAVLRNELPLLLRERAGRGEMASVRGRRHVSLAIIRIMSSVWSGSFPARTWSLLSVR